MSIDKESIRRRALDLIARGRKPVATLLATEFGLSRQVANGYLKALTREGLIEADGSTRARVYRLVDLSTVERSFPLDGLQEDVVSREVIAPEIANLAENVRRIWAYASTEMINNAIDHSGGTAVRVNLRRNALSTEVEVEDDGEGIFLKIQRSLDLHDPREAILELAKGKLTTAPERHSGEGIFFTSRMLDLFEIRSGSLRFRHGASVPDVIEEEVCSIKGTLLLMRLDNDSQRMMTEVFDAFADPEDYTFNRTLVPLRLARHGEEALVSRSQAKRVAHRFERFKRVELDFEGVPEIGQAFADELFRVFASAHPEIQLTPVNTTSAVANMIRRAAGARAEKQPGSAPIR